MVCRALIRKPFALGVVAVLGTIPVLACEEGVAPPTDPTLNTPPQFTSTPSTSVMVGEAYSYSVAVADSDGDEVTVTAPTLPTWLALSAPAPPGSPTLSGTPAIGDAGNAAVLLRASDGEATTDQSFRIVVVAPPGQVTNLADDGAGSLRDAVTQAAPGSTVGFSPALSGTLTLSSPISLNKNLTISGPGSAGITVSGGGNTRLFTVGSGASVQINSLTLANGRSGIEGGAIHNDGSLTVRRVVFRNNDALFDGGAISNDATLVVEESEFVGNSAGADGGAISNNLAATINRSTFEENESAAEGGAVSSTGQLTITSSTFDDNFAGTDGGAVLHEGSTMSVSNSTIVGNRANIEGGGLFADAVSFSLANTVVFGNAANFGGTDIQGPVDSEGFNLIGITSGASITGDVATNLVGADPQVGALADNGGPTRTLAIDPMGPAVDAGSCSGVSTDQRGFTRPVDLSASNAVDGCDIGAFEVQAPPG